MNVRQFLREPLLHFLLIGGLLFLAYRVLNPDERSDDTIVIDAARTAALENQFQRLWQRPPTRHELDGLIDSFVREEIYFREGLSLGLDRDDPVVRRRVSQKMAFLAEDVTPQEANDSELQQWLDEHADKYAVEARYSLEQVYFDPTRHRSLEADIARARRSLEQTPSTSRSLGDRTMLPASVAAMTLTDVGNTFGSQFAAALAELPVGSWSGPVTSGFGVHLVRIDLRDDKRKPQLNEVRQQVERDFLYARAQEEGERSYQKLRANYVVRIEAGSAGSATAMSGE